MSEKNDSRKKRVMSGIQPTGKAHIGNLFGAIKNWASLQNEYECFYSIVDLHAITVRNKPAELRKNVYEIAALLLAAGVEPNEEVALFVQSRVPEHAQLQWALNCLTPIGDLNRMTQFKDKSKKNAENINAGLFVYPVLQAADILLYQADLVPVGVDQKQHLELTRDIAQRFNNLYSETFVLPEPLIPKTVGKIMSLQEPTKKMSKSDENEKSAIFIDDDDKVVKNKIKRAVTDSGSEVKYDPENKPGVSNLMSIYNAATNKSFEEIEKEFAGLGYGDFKQAVAEALAEYLRPIREKYLELRSDKKTLENVLKRGEEKARRVAAKTLRKVYKKIGFVQF